eukprot:6205718-Pleurochrysis_carterae.AAC.6
MPPAERRMLRAASFRLLDYRLVTLAADNGDGMVYKSTEPNMMPFYRQARVAFERRGHDAVLSNPT